VAKSVTNNMSILGAVKLFFLRFNTFLSQDERWEKRSKKLVIFELRSAS